MGFQDIWTLPVVVYLFLGGLSGGVFVCATLLRQRLPGRIDRTICTASWLSAILLPLGLGFLLFDALNPIRALHVWQSFASTSSWITCGAWIAFVSEILFLSVALLSTRGFVRTLAMRFPFFASYYRQVRMALIVLAFPFALGLAGYAGALLGQAQGIPFWSSPLLCLLFVVSALCAGLNAIILLSLATNDFRRLVTECASPLLLAAFSLAFLEMVILALYLAAQSGLFASIGYVLPPSELEASRASVNSIILGAYDIAFWVLTVGAGLLLPLACAAASYFLPEAMKPFMAIAAIGVLIGEFSLRYLIVFAGVHVDHLSCAMLILA